jgi:hypothetical protein
MPTLGRPAPNCETDEAEPCDKHDPRIRLGDAGNHRLRVGKHPGQADSTATTSAASDKAAEARIAERTSKHSLRLEQGRGTVS